MEPKIKQFFCMGLRFGFDESGLHVAGDASFTDAEKEWLKIEMPKYRDGIITEVKRMQGSLKNVIALSLPGNRDFSDEGNEIMKHLTPDAVTRIFETTIKQKGLTNERI
jgi:hypothetical protein